uniref:Uncharacterized protein n=1 Tax=Rhizophora mucronata TaxID=61149 RepID=A0A2P2K9S5_RHIMU
MFIVEKNSLAYFNTYDTHPKNISKCCTCILYLMGQWLPSSQFSSCFK